jgi:hypothetical protein
MGPIIAGLFFTAGPVEEARTNKVMGFVVPQGRERMMGYGRFEDVVNVSSSRGDASAPVRRRCVRGRSMTHWRRSKPNCQLLRPKRDELNPLDFDTSRHYPRLPLFHGREVD